MHLAFRGGAVGRDTESTANRPRRRAASPALLASHRRAFRAKAAQPPVVARLAVDSRRFRVATVVATTGNTGTRGGAGSQMCEQYTGNPGRMDRGIGGGHACREILRFPAWPRRRFQPVQLNQRLAGQSPPGTEPASKSSKNCWPGPNSIPMEPRPSARPEPLLPPRAATCGCRTGQMGGYELLNLD
jgi:hypothetical protein